MDENPARSGFEAAIQGPEEGWSLARAALWIAASEYPGLDVEAYVAKLDTMAEAIRERLPADRYPMRLIGAVNAYLFELQGFHGNSAQYYDPRNSFLNEVIDRRTGIPITLSVVYLELGWRLGMPLEGIGFPGHFLVKYLGVDVEVWIDPFQKGEALMEVDLRERLSLLYGAETDPSLFGPASKRQILTRMLNNLKAIYMRLGDVRRAHEAADRLLLLNPESPAELKERGMLSLQLQRVAEAIADLERYAEVAPDAQDLPHIRQIIEEARRWRPQA